MSKQTLSVTDDLYKYLIDTSSRESDLLNRLRNETAKDPMARMQIAPEQGQFMQLLVKLTGARKILEVGTFTGYSSIVMAQAMVRPAQLICCDVSEEWTSVAKRYWTEACVEDICDLRLAPALETMEGLVKSGEHKSFDMVFIDADKTNYDFYYEAALKLLKAGGLLLLDNTLWSGRVADPRDVEPDTVAIRALNKKLQSDCRIELSHLPVADGLTLCLKR